MGRTHAVLGDSQWPVGPHSVTTMGPVLRESYGQMHFAGEYACWKFVGYMEGALNSGVTVAREIAIRDGVMKG